MTFSVYDDNNNCNTALTLIGAEPIVSIMAPATDREAACARIYYTLLDALLGAHDWNWAKHTAKLAYEPEAKAEGGFDRAFRLPGDLIAGPFAVKGDHRKATIRDWIVAGVHLHTSFTVVEIEYRRRAPAHTWPAYFADLFHHALASRLAIPERESVSMRDSFKEDAFGPPQMEGRGGLYGKATRIDAQSKPIKSLFQNGDPLTATRR